ncbi:hypothetical protein [Mucilaginibacter ginsenosidivorans]|uniref:Uncharacterized protein n=1 Tax=Mucilaginibacter ginsenosidivorans TaxID=398053 RepID=A0A5B8UUN9_9SPHI|nr:hypothetical protein [Mucilaginibacter ginsenosidivorans]QEC62485.1 hypothetical protein FRZ54_07755 [Mucilaginibacter ginsenosidivorans]
MASQTIDTGLPLVYKGVKIIVRKHIIGMTEVYRAIFADNRPPLLITTAKNDKGRVFWTSVPEGRLEEANDIAMLVDEHYFLIK